MPDPLRGEVWRVDLDPVEGSETGKVRPVIVISDETLGRLPVRLVVPVTSWQERYRIFPWMTKLEPTPPSGLAKPSAADALQMRVASLNRFQQRLGRLPAPVLNAIAESIAVCIRLEAR